MYSVLGEGRYNRPVKTSLSVTLQSLLGLPLFTVINLEIGRLHHLRDAPRGQRAPPPVLLHLLHRACHHVSPDCASFFLFSFIMFAECSIDFHRPLFFLNRA